VQYLRVPLPILRAYVDETGDRGTSGKSSDFFAFACVMVADEDEPSLRAAISRLRRDLNVPVGKALHWNEHVKQFPRRQHVTNVLGALRSVVVQYVLVEKAAIPPQARMRADQAVFYNYAAAMVLERILLSARDWPGGSRRAIVRFGHVRGFRHNETTDYFNLRIARNSPHWVPWNLLAKPATFDGQANWDGLQAADQYAGMLSAAIRRDQFGNYEPHHFLSCSHQIRRVDGRSWSYGFKFMGNEATLRALPWWGRSGT
jgi:hypothetical protein